jgi:hypothetical protein
MLTLQLATAERNQLKAHAAAAALHALTYADVC